MKRKQTKNQLGKRATTVYNRKGNLASAPQKTDRNVGSQNQRMITAAKKKSEKAKEKATPLLARWLGL